MTMRVWNAFTWTVLAVAAASGCLLVTPLDDLPSTQAAGAGGAQGGSGGKPGQVIPDGGVDASSGAGGAPDSGLCRTNADCVDQGAGAPYLCRPSDQTCVPLLSEACPLAYDEENVKDPNAVLFGAFAPLTNVRPGDNSIIWAHRLALRELNGDSIPGIPGGPGGARRKLVMVVCNSAEASVAPAFEHLIEELEVPAVLATLRSGDLREQYERYQSRGIFYLSPIAVSSVVANEDDGGRIWSLLGQPRDFAPTYRALLERAEAYVRAERNLDAQTPIKAVLVGSADALDYELATAITPGLVLNGQPASADPEHFKRVDLPVNPNYADEAAKVGEFHPDIVISAASEKFSASNALQAQL
ncbi:MAG: Branched-chain amino acid transporter, amino acid-binding protein, partial [Polyangiaceae bacterium]|nr:Branched-chain amino acid transporter, amino acid-binding protein [Polyangiaceae bacterium]